MTNVTYLSASVQGAPLSAGVSLLNCVPRLSFDPLLVKSIYARLPLPEAEDLICRFLEDIALRLDQLQRGLAARNTADMVRPARRVVLAARQLGLIEVAESAQHVVTCLSLDDGVALEAVMARLERAFDVAVNEVWNLREM